MFVLTMSTADQHTTPSEVSCLPYEGLDTFIERISVDRPALEAGDRRAPQYTIFRNISEEEFEHKIATKGSNASICGQFRYNTETKDLVVKLPGEGHALISTSRPRDRPSSPGWRYPWQGSILGDRVCAQ